MDGNFSPMVCSPVHLFKRGIGKSLILRGSKRCTGVYELAYHYAPPWSQHCGLSQWSWSGHTWCVAATIASAIMVSAFSWLLSVLVCHHHRILPLHLPTLVTASATTSLLLLSPPSLMPCIIQQLLLSLVAVICSSPLMALSAVLVVIVGFIVGWRGRRHCRICCLCPGSMGHGKICDTHYT